ncbi:MAG TPA: RNA-guided pseudouridylation complex pseudouridine synthase subunit Cbf5 [Nitrososphaerales archaeon]|nr:RNA-guided pseudouridylation complex pseudouridine synthase subunit Cbf5 [Nitrososphaerales archaeon]
MQSQEVVVVDEEPIDFEHGWDPKARPIEVMLDYGLIALDKPRGPTSHEVVAWVRKILGVERAGHSGTLDPPVSGLLPVATGQATKALGLLLLYPKEYKGVMRLHSSVPVSTLKTVIHEFQGEIFQRPPQRSSVARQVRSRTIHELEIDENRGNIQLFRCLCESGTYVRKLVYDIGEVLGVGATMVELRRTKVGPFDEADGIVTMHQLSDAVYRLRNGEDVGLRSLIRPVEEVVGPTKKVTIRDSAVDAICHGARLGVPGLLSASAGITKGDLLVMMTAKGELVAVGKAMLSTSEMATLKKGLACSTERVIMKQGTYPKLWKSNRGQKQTFGTQLTAS